MLAAGRERHSEDQSQVHCSLTLPPSAQGVGWAETLATVWLLSVSGSGGSQLPCWEDTQAACGEARAMGDRGCLEAGPGLNGHLPCQPLTPTQGEQPGRAQLQGFRVHVPNSQLFFF